MSRNLEQRFGFLKATEWVSWVVDSFLHTSKDLESLWLACGLPQLPIAHGFSKLTLPVVLTDIKYFLLPSPHFFSLGHMQTQGIQLVVWGCQVTGGKEIRKGAPRGGREVGSKKRGQSLKKKEAPFHKPPSAKWNKAKQIHTPSQN